MKLKTLKEIREEFRENYGVEIPDQAEVYPRIRAEAIKWVKFYFEGREDSLNIKMYEEADKCEHTAGFIINFFNITEEELEGGKENDSK